MNELKQLKARKPELAAKQVGNELVLVPLQGSVADLNEMFTLNEVGSFIWACLDESDSEEEICTKVVEEFDIDAETAQTDVTNFLSDLSKFLLKEQ
ncbi:MAG: PqqD family protein [Flavobacteriales bacterium]|nr:PqqD family protein [Flavobacteriales bacterium]